MLEGAHVHSAGIPGQEPDLDSCPPPLRSGPISLSGTISFGTGPAMPVGIEAHSAPEPV